MHNELKDIKTLYLYCSIHYIELMCVPPSSCYLHCTRLLTLACLLVVCGPCILMGEGLVVTRVLALNNFFPSLC